MHHNAPASAASAVSSSLDSDAFIPYMRSVTRCETSLRELNLMWRLIESSAKMNCPQEAHAILPMMAATRAGFEQLEQELVQSMVQQSVSGVMAGLATQAQHVIDTLVRNLYERTADVGFLATDSVLCRYVAGLSDGTGVQERLRAYRSKYSVYNAIMLLDIKGQVMAQTDGDSPVEGSQDPLLAHSLASTRYVETFRATDLRPHLPQALVYSHRLLHPVSGVPVGVLCLCFDFEGEMQSIFSARAAGLAGKHQGSRSIALLVDGSGHVLASSDAHWLGATTPVPTHHDAEPQLHVHAGRTYLVQSARSAGYQGYPGPAGWQGQVMVPVEQAFTGQGQQLLEQLAPHVAQGLLAHAHRFCPPLHAIITAADTIRRVVWNGQVMTAGEDSDSTRLQAVLEQIGETGARTNEVFAQSIRTLYDTVLSAALRDNALLSRLLVDLLDRNLYERANDCRWWALTPQLQTLLAAANAGQATQNQVQQGCALLTGIHDLYTVYHQIVVYDRSGRIVASSLRAEVETPSCAPASTAGLPALAGDPPHPLLGLQIEADTLAQVRALAHSQAYHVTPWRPNALDAIHPPGAPGRTPPPTYAYHAAIRGEDGQMLGGIGLVFHAARELRAMLDSAVPAQGSGGLQTRVFYLDRQGLVMASTDPLQLPGSHMALPAELLQTPNGESRARAMVHAGQYCIVAATASSGYREFKRSDGYRDEVLAVSLQVFGHEQEDAVAAVRRRSIRIQSAAPSQQAHEMATFFVGSQLMALDAACVLEALSASAIAPVSAGRMPYCVGTLARHSQGQVTGYVWVFDLGALLHGQASTLTAQSQVIVLQHAGRQLGVLVSDLQGVARFTPAQIIPAPAMAPTQRPLLDALIKANDGSLLIQCLSPSGLLQMLQGQAQAIHAA
ncbi:chemotaxis protein CheW [Comamonas sp. GB3 AK4-5]|uniref:chemotaxis protein CheW n=1 Tax=Comamonas sp. GB3 AK4-5 TaxID=3231487 RepID=UPI00351F384A